MPMDLTNVGVDWDAEDALLRYHWRLLSMVVMSTIAPMPPNEVKSRKEGRWDVLRGRLREEARSGI